MFNFSDFSVSDKDLLYLCFLLCSLKLFIFSYISFSMVLSVVFSVLILICFLSYWVHCLNTNKLFDFLKFYFIAILSLLFLFSALFYI